MSTVRNTGALAALIWGLAFGGPWLGVPLAADAQDASILPGPLVTPQWLNDHLMKVTVIDIRDDLAQLTVEPKYAADKKTGKQVLVEAGGHIRGALSLEFGKIRQSRAVDGVTLASMLPTKEFFEKAMDDAGLDKGAAVVIAPVGDSVESLDMATRLYFQLKYFGDDDVAILNGGMNAWLTAGYPVSEDQIVAKPGDWAAAGERADILATTQDVKAAVAASATQLVDARPTAQFLGIAKSPVVLVAGHVQGARSFPPDAVARAAGGAKEFLTADEYRKIFAQETIDPDRPLIAYCNTGHYASGAWFVAHEILKDEKARLYAGSMNEWTHLSNPVVGLQ